MVAIRHVVIALSACLLQPHERAIAETTDGKQKTPVSVTQKDFNKPIKVQSGDIIEVRLPMLLPLAWVTEPEQSCLTPVKGYPRIDKVPPDPNAQVPPLGAGQFWVHRYTVSTSKQVTLPVGWVYCRNGNLSLTKERVAKKVVPKPPHFRPDLKSTDLREGMVFKIKLVVSRQ
jgi:hypothetical protein